MPESYRFPLIVSCVGLVYALTILAFKTAFGKEAEGAAGIAMTALITALYQKYQKSLPDALKIGKEVHRNQSWQLMLLLSFGFLGTQLLVGFSLGVVRLKYPSIPPLTEFRAGLPIALAVLTVSYLMTGILISLSIPKVRLTTLAWSIFIAYFSDILLQVAVPIASKDWFGLKQSLRVSAPVQVFCMLYIAAGTFPSVLKNVLSRGR